MDFSAHREAVASQLVVGRSCTTGDAGLHAFLRDGTDDADLGTFGGTERVAYGVNDSGYVVGTAQSTGDGSFRAFVYDVVIKHQIGTFGGVNSAAYGINAAGILVGDANNTSFDREAFLYDGNTLYNLNAFISPTIGWTIRDARDIDAHGARSRGYFQNRFSSPIELASGLPMLKHHASGVGLGIIAAG